MAADYLTKEEERELIAKAQSGDINARNTLIERNKGLMAETAFKHARKFGGDKDAFFGVATMALIFAITRFNPKYGRLSTLAVIVMRRWIAREAFEQGGIMYVPGAYAGGKGWERAPKHIKEAVARARRRPLSTDLSADSDGATLGERLAFREEQRTEDGPSWEDVADAIAKLDDRTQGIIRMRMDGLTAVETAAAIGISRQRVLQLEWAAYRKIRESLGFEPDRPKGSRMKAKPKKRGAR